MAPERKYKKLKRDDDFIDEVIDSEASQAYSVPETSHRLCTAEYAD